MNFFYFVLIPRTRQSANHLIPSFFFPFFNSRASWSVIDISCWVSCFHSHNQPFLTLRCTLKSSYAIASSCLWDAVLAALLRILKTDVSFDGHQAINPLFSLLFSFLFLFLFLFFFFLLFSDFSTGEKGNDNKRERETDEHKKKNNRKQQKTKTENKKSKGDKNHLTMPCLASTPRRSAMICFSFMTSL